MIYSIGDNKIEAINWVQDQYLLDRLLAEDIVTDAIKSGMILLSEDGVFVDDEKELHKHASSKKISNRIKYGKSRLRVKIRNKLNNISTNSSNDPASMADLMASPSDDQDDDK